MTRISPEYFWLNETNLETQEKMISDGNSADNPFIKFLIRPF